MNLRTSEYHIGDVMLQPHDFDQNGKIKNINALMCRKVRSVLLPSSKAQMMFDAYVRSSVDNLNNKPSAFYLCFSQVERTMCYDLDISRSK